MTSYKRPHGSIGQSSHDNHNSFGGNGIKGAFGSNLILGHFKDAKAHFKKSFEVVQL
jgi:hypothetical protein